MGHDISGYNKTGKEIAYARFSMWNGNAGILYDLLDCKEYNAGVSGSGESSIFTIEEIKKALNDYKQRFNTDIANDESDYDQKQILNFILNCLDTAQKEERVKVSFG